MNSLAGNVQFLAGVVFVLAMLDSAHASADFKKCCVQAARAKYALYLPSLPWDTCAINSNATGSAAPINPSVNITLDWCQQNCPGHQPSSTSEWLHPITTWIIPYAGLLFLCPVAERGERALDRSMAWTNRLIAWVSNVSFQLLEYGGFLGDPASAIWGAFSELAEDWWLSGIMLHATDLRRELLAAVILAGQGEFNEKTNKRMTEALVTRILLDIVGHEDSKAKRGSQDEKSQNSKSEIITPVDDMSPDIPHLTSKEIGTIVVEKERLAPLTTTALRRKLEGSLEIEGERLWDDIDATKIAKALVAISEGRDVSHDLFSDGSPRKFRTALAQILKTYNQRPIAERTTLLIREGTFTYKLWDGIRVLLEARVDFVNTILIPVILMLVVTASVFYDAYQNLGDNDTAHSLAYGLLYSWLIILAVAANCYTSSLTYGLVARVLPIPPATVHLRERYTNALRWRRWLGDIGIVDRPVHSNTRVLIKYLVGQLLGWACVAIVAACAAAISYSTPTVGIGCRSFNQLLYALMSLVVCMVPVILYWNELRQGTKYNKYITLFYRLLLTCNVAVLLIGTLLHLIGTFRSCRCMNLFGRHTALLELNTQTEQAVHNATIYWLPVGYVAFIFIWCVSGSAIVMRQVINFRVGILQSLCLGERVGRCAERIPSPVTSTDHVEGVRIQVDKERID
jgi:hypothetical protein